MSVEKLGDTGPEFSVDPEVEREFALDAALELLTRIVSDDRDLGPGVYDHIVTPARVNGIQKLQPGALSVSVLSAGDGKGFGDWHIAGEDFQIGQTASYKDSTPRVLSTVDMDGYTMAVWSTEPGAEGWLLANTAIRGILNGSYTVAQGNIDGVVR